MTRWCSGSTSAPAARRCSRTRSCSPRRRRCGTSSSRCRRRSTRTCPPRPGGEEMAEYVKRAQLPPAQASEEVKQTVSEMLSRIEREGIAAIRDYSERLDGWSPPSLLVDAAEIESAGEQLDDELRGHIAFAQDQVRTFAQRQRQTLNDLETEVRPGVTLGHRHIPVAAVGSYVPGGRYPMLASAFMTVLTPK